jgi:hypothetical protein
MNQQCQQHFPYGKLFQTEHFDILVKRCRLCDEFVGIESAVRKVVEQPKPPEPGEHFDQLA